MSTTLHREPPFRAEHLGSLLRPTNLLDKRAEVHEAKAKPEELKPLEDAAIKDIVAKQQEWGYRALSDGEYRYAPSIIQGSRDRGLPEEARGEGQLGKSD